MISESHGVMAGKDKFKMLCLFGCVFLQATGIDGIYRMTCEVVMEVLRQNKDSLMAVLEAFVYDPLLNWRLVEGMLTS